MGLFINGTGSDDTLRGGDENDVIRGEGGNDKLYGDAGDDILHGGDGSDLLDGGSGNDALFGDGGDDKLYGGYGDDWLTGGTGNDYLVGGKGNDTYFFDKGWGNDTIYQYDHYRKDETDVIRFGAGITIDDIKVSRSGSDLYLTHKGTGDKISITGHFAGVVDLESYSSSAYDIQKVLFADGTGWNQEMLFLLANATPTSAPMSFSAANYNAAEAASTLSIDSLVSSMAAFAVPDAAASTGLLSAQATALQPLMLSVAHA